MNDRWWARKGGDIHDEVVALAERIHVDQTARRLLLEEYRDAYLDRARENFTRRVTHNVCAGNVDTAMAKIAKNKPRVQVLPTGGDAMLRRKAKQLTKFLDGWAAQTKVHAKARGVFFDACVGDFGAMLLYTEGERIDCERVYPEELLIDEREAYYGEPRQIIRRRQAHRDVLAGLFGRDPETGRQRPAAMAAIKAAPSSSDPLKRGRVDTEMVDVYEIWHLPSYEGAKDGRRAVCIKGATLLDERYERDWFPFVFFHWKPPARGFFGTGIVEEVFGIQREINQLLDNVRVAQKRLGRPVIWIPAQAEVAKSKISNEIAALYEYKGGQKPEVQVLPAMPAEIYQYIDRLIQRSFEVTGVSQSSSRGQKPAGLESGVAIREALDIESERFVLVGQRWEEFFLEVADRVVAMARGLYEDGVADVRIKAREKSFIESISWSDVDMDEDAYALQAWPVSMLPTQPEGRRQMVVDLASNGLIDPPTAKRLLDLPDVERALDLENASLDALSQILDSMVAGGDYIPPEPYWDLATAKKLAIATLMRCKVEKVPEDDQEKIRTLLADIVELENAAAGPPRGAPAGPPPGPESALPNAQMPGNPLDAAMAGTMPAMPGISGDAMDGNAMTAAAAMPPAG